jgi:hypothetical protein
VPAEVLLTERATETILEKDLMPLASLKGARHHPFIQIPIAGLGRDQGWGLNKSQIIANTIALTAAKAMSDAIHSPSSVIREVIAFPLRALE